MRLERPVRRFWEFEVKILFICKKRQLYGQPTYALGSSGLFNSTRFVAEALGADLVEVVDNNDIDREVTKAKADAVVIEALWVVPEKFHILKKLHPKVRWFIHLHSDIPFLAIEGMAFDWLNKYVLQGVGILANCKNAFSALKEVLGEDHVVYLPNIYPSKGLRSEAFQEIRSTTQVHVGCFGAIRSMKNQVTQAIAAIKFAREIGKVLVFHINAGRIETEGGNVIKNLRALFEGRTDAMLIEHPWMTHEQFIKLLKCMDIGLQVSLSETFNHVTADMVSVGLPVVVSNQVPWISGLSVADCASVDDIEKKMWRAYWWRTIVDDNQVRLWFYSRKARKLWHHWADSLN